MTSLQGIIDQAREISNSERRNIGILAPTNWEDL